MTKKNAKDVAAKDPTAEKTKEATEETVADEPLPGASKKASKTNEPKDSKADSQVRQPDAGQPEFDTGNEKTVEGKTVAGTTRDAVKDAGHPGHPAEVPGTAGQVSQLEAQCDKLVRYIDFLHKNHPNKLVTLKQWEAKTSG